MIAFVYTQPPRTHLIAQVLERFLNLSDTRQIPWIPLRPRALNEASIFDEAFEFLIDEARFDEILRRVFRICQDAGLSFILVQGAAAERQILLLEEASGRQVSLTLRSHAGAQALDRPRRRRAGRRRIKPPAPGTTVVVGPDGSGKTALLEGLRQMSARRPLRIKRFKRYFRRVLFHMRRAEHRNDREEKTLWLIWPIAWLHFSLSRWLAGWARPLVLDRYFYDYLVRDVRSDSRPLRRIAAYDLCSALVPRPRRLIVASCPAAIIRSRKAEMSLESIEALYQVYLDQVIRSGVAQTLFCHTGIALDISVRQVAAFLEGSHIPSVSRRPGPGA